MFPHDASERRYSGGCVSRTLRFTPHFPPSGQRSSVYGFTLLELLVVIGIVALLMVLLAPAYTNLKSGGDVTSAAWTIKGVLDTARTYAKAKNTYTWVGFFEEEIASATAGVPGTGRVVMSIIASKDGTMLYTGNLTTNVVLDQPTPCPLIQVGKLVKIDNMHLKGFTAPTGTSPPDSFDARPSFTSAAAQIGDAGYPPNPALSFRYPVGSSSPQYTFTKAVQFSPRGESVITNNAYTFARVSEIGVEPTHGAAVPSSTPANVVAIQFNGFAALAKAEAAVAEL
jgi:prepilin-type N-terminal cleavage/methylation domain-containing protein